ncbi:uncharacterized protein LOC109367679 isoform X2 [Meleagris gallopavo]|uniref:uncharacterized protein LOC109367679 isoform X2 n=1 Tax=Meleagris gallopavo TaxID=9103 RepID=UPI00093962CD|nr:uncharacterized protein LOC109367679 isoform X2 [Meleagris gallopavo]
MEEKRLPTQCVPTESLQPHHSGTTEGEVVLSQEKVPLFSSTFTLNMTSRAGSTPRPCLLPETLYFCEHTQRAPPQELGIYHIIVTATRGENIGYSKRGTRMRMQVAVSLDGAQEIGKLWATGCQIHWPIHHSKLRPFAAPLMFCLRHHSSPGATGLDPKAPVVCPEAASSHPLPRAP